MQSTIERFKKAGEINKSETVWLTFLAVAPKSGNTFNIQEVIFAIRSQGIAEEELSDKDIKNRASQVPSFNFQKLGKGWFTRKQKFNVKRGSILLPLWRFTVTYKFIIWQFSDKEIDQIVKLVQKWATGSLTPIDRRRYSKQVLDYAERYKLIKKGSDMKMKPFLDENDNMGMRLPDWVKPDRYHISDDDIFDPAWNLPQEVLYQILKPALEKSSGRSIVRSKVWLQLNIAPEGHKWHNGFDDIKRMMNILNNLMSWNYIIFQYAGDIWRIELTEDRAIRSES